MNEEFFGRDVNTYPIEGAYGLHVASARPDPDATIVRTSHGADRLGVYTETVWSDGYVTRSYPNPTVEQPDCFARGCSFLVQRSLAKLADDYTHVPPGWAMGDPLPDDGLPRLSITITDFRRPNWQADITTWLNAVHRQLDGRQGDGA